MRLKTFVEQPLTSRGNSWTFFSLLFKYSVQRDSFFLYYINIDDRAFIGYAETIGRLLDLENYKIMSIV